MPTRGWCFRTLDIDIAFGEYQPEANESPWGLDMLAIGPHDAARSVQVTGDGAWARPAWATPSTKTPSELLTDRAILMHRSRPLLPGSSIRGPLRHIFSRLMRMSGQDVQDPHLVQGKVSCEDPGGKLFGNVALSSRVLIRDAVAEAGWAAARLHLHAEDEFSAGSFGTAKRDAVRLLRGVFPVRIVVEGPEAAVVDPLVAEVDRLAALGVLGHLPLGGHKTRGAGWGRWQPKQWVVHDVTKARSWTPPQGGQAAGERRMRAAGKETALAWVTDNAKEDARVRVATGLLQNSASTLSEVAGEAKSKFGARHTLVAWWCDPAIKLEHLDQVRAKLAAAGLEMVVDGDTNVSMPVAQPLRSGRATPRRDPALQPSASSAAPNLQKKPYGFVPLPKEFSTAPPVWHDGTCAGGRLSGELRCELETLTPKLVGWERAQIVPTENEEVTWPIPFRWINRESKEVEVQLCGKKYRSSATKSLLCPLRAPWGDRPVFIPGDSLKGLLRHELGALLGAPMERVAERSYSYRPNALYPKDRGAYLVPRLARVPKDGVQMRPLHPEHSDPPVRVPIRLELLSKNLQYDKDRRLIEKYYRFDEYRFDEPGGAPYRGGQGAGVMLNSKRNLHKSLAANPSASTDPVEVPKPVQQGYLATLRHLTNLEHGHFSERHPDVPNTVTGEDARTRILQAAADEVFEPGDLIWVEWDTRRKCIVSLGWHYSYRWAYVPSGPRWRGS
jgi:hypothetical protein